MSTATASQSGFSDAAVPLLILDPQQDVLVAANRAMRQLLGLASASALPRASALFAPSFPEWIVFTQELMTRRTGWNDRLRIRCDTANGAGLERRVEVCGHCVGAGDELRLHLSLQDADVLAHRRQQSEAQRHYLSGMGHWARVATVFQEFERENQLLLDAAGEGIYGVDAKGITTFVNPAAQRILGYSADELAGRNMHSMVHHHHADGSDFSVEECPIFAAFRDGTVHRVDDDVFWSKSGQPIDVEYTSTPILDNGYGVGAVVVFRDVTEKKADRKRLLEALNEVEKLKNRLELENAYLQEEINSEFNHHQILGKSAAIQHTISQVQLVAPTNATVLIHGESGTGKELIARAIHESSQRSQRSLIRVNCAAIPAELFESEFFGHMKGAFTGAHSDRLGRFELADGGTLFLDEVGEIPLHLQGKLLRVLQEQQFERVGDGRTRHVDVRIIAATNRDLKQQVAAGKFREDLYFRLNVFPIESVPLRQRREDIGLLTQHFLQKSGQRINRPVLRLPLSELQKLEAYHWPGNIRELENVVERQVILARGDSFRFDGLSAVESGGETAPVQSYELAAAPEPMTHAELKSLDRRNLLAALTRCGGKVFGRDGAAALLGIKPTTLASRIKKYNIDVRSFRQT